MTQDIPPRPMKSADDLPPAVMAQIAALAKRSQAAGGPLMQMVNFAGGRLEGWLESLPDTAKEVIEDKTRQALHLCYDTAGTPGLRRAMAATKGNTHQWGAALSGAVGGVAGLGSALVELPATITLIFGSIQQVAAEYGFDPNCDETRVDCLKVFASGGPLAGDDGVDTSFLSARLVVNGASLHALIARIAPRFATVLSQKLAAQTVPILGALAGAGINYAFMGYYREMAHVRFALKRLALDHGPEAVAQAFAAQSRSLARSG